MVPSRTVIADQRTHKGTLVICRHTPKGPCACYAGGSGAAATDQDSTTRLIHVIRSSHVMHSPRGTKPSLAEAEAGDPRRSLC